MHTVFKTGPEERRSSRGTNVPPAGTRKYARGQEVEVRSDQGRWKSGRIVDFGHQEILPLYWVRIDGSSQEVPKLEFELDLKGEN